MTELISIIIPVFNLEKYIRGTVESICNQTYRDLEIILVDDGSKDNSPAILDEMKEMDSRIKVIHQKNGGVTKARLTGVMAASGEWIGFVDGDDLIEPDMYERLWKNAIDYGADISHCGYQMVFPSRIDYYYNTDRIVQQDRITGVKDLLTGKFIEPGLCNKLFRKNLFSGLLNGNIMDTTIKNTADLLMNYYLFSKSDGSIYEDFCPYHYMVRKGSAATASINNNKLYDPLRVLRIIKVDIDDSYADLHRIIDGRILALLISHATMRDEGNRELIAPCRNAARQEIRKNLFQIIVGDYSRKQKVLALWVAVWPWSFTMVHECYGHITGADKKYVVE